MKSLAGALGWGLLWGAEVLAQVAPLQGRVVDARSLEPLAGAWVEARPDHGHSRQAYTDSAGWFQVKGLSGHCWVEAQRLGYERARREVEVGEGGAQVELRLQAQPLVVEGMVVRAPRQAQAPAFVEVIRLEEDRSPTASLPEILEQAAGVQVRRQGGLGSFSTLSIRGSTAEQVQVYLDGVPLNQAIGGGVDLGGLPVGGIESVEIYRGAVPARFGGNSLGGVVHLRTRAAGAGGQLRLQGLAGSFGTWQASGSASGPWKGGNYLGLVEGTASQNDFRFLDDNGTQYNPGDDEWARRRNSDYLGLRALLKAERPWGRARVQAHHTLDLKHQGIPGLGNYQAEAVRFDTWRDIAQVEISGLASAAAGYRLVAYHVLEQDSYKDPKSEVGTGVQRTRNTTRTAGTQAELHLVAGRSLLVTALVQGHREVFSPADLLRPLASLPASRRLRGLGGGEFEWGLWGDRLRLSAGGQAEVLQDAFSGTALPALSGTEHHNTQALIGGRLGGQWRLAAHWVAQGHIGRYRRPPSFFELFGDRGAVIGNTELRSEKGDHWDVGLVFRRPGAGLRLLEGVYYHKVIDDLIRFVQNSQQVSRPYNIGRARLQGLEARGEARVGRALQLSGNYTYQRPLNQSAFPFERGRDLPNAPRHALNLRTTLAALRGGEIYYELSRQSRHFLDRANLRPVRRRTLHTLGAGVRRAGGLEVSAEIRNLTGQQVEDLWGYPLPGRAYFLVVRKEIQRVASPITR